MKMSNIFYNLVLFVMYIAFDDCFACLSPCCTKTTFEQEITCPSSFRVFQRPYACLKIVNTEVSWDEAKRNCERLQARLIRLDDKFLDAAISDLVASDYIGYWIGLSDTKSEGVFLWVDDPEPSIWHNWGLSQPNNFFGDQNCVEKGGLGGGLWSDENCSKAFRYICEKPVRPPVIASKSSSSSSSTSLLGGDVYRIWCTAHFNTDSQITFMYTVDGHTTYINQPDYRIQNLNSGTTFKIVNGSCRREARVKLELAITIGLDGSAWFCCLTSQEYVEKCVPGDAIKVTVRASELRLRVEIELDKPKYLKAKCSAYVGVNGSLTWHLRHGLHQISWRIKLDGSVLLQNHYASYWALQSKVVGPEKEAKNVTLGIKDVKFHYDQMKGPWIGSRLVAYLTEVVWLEGAQLTCMVNQNLKKSTQIISFLPRTYLIGLTGMEILLWVIFAALLLLLLSLCAFQLLSKAKPNQEQSQSNLSKATIKDY